MRYIFLDSSTNNGGIENFIIESIDYIIRYNKKVSIITYGKKSLYEERFRENRNVDVIFYKNSIRTDFKLEYKIKKIKKQILKEININIDEEYCIITPYFTNLQIAMYIFKDIENVKILHIWGHPEDWINTLNIKYNILNHKKKKYQKSLLKSLNASNSDFYGAEVVPIYNSKFYDVNLKYNEIDTFPIVNIDEVKNEYYFNPNSSTIKILWVGRFDYWKNESIIHIAKEIEYILDIYPKIDIEFDIVGAGKGENDKYLRDALSSYNVKVKYHGLIESKCLSSFMKNYDIGIGMGLTVKKMAQIGLPAIVIDSVDKEFKNEIKCEWLFNTKNGDAGDGYYLKKAEIGRASCRERV